MATKWLEIPPPIFARRISGKAREAGRQELESRGSDSSFRSLSHAAWSQVARSRPAVIVSNMLAHRESAMIEDQFTRAEATSLIGTRLQAAHDFPSVPAGACGTVVRVRSLEDGYGLVVRWDRPKRRKQYYAQVLDFSFNVSLLRSEPQVTDDFTKAELSRLTRPIQASQSDQGLTPSDSTPKQPSAPPGPCCRGGRCRSQSSPPGQRVPAHIASPCDSSA